MTNLITRKYLGVIEGLQTWEVSNAETNEIIGYDQSAPSEEQQ